MFGAADSSFFVFHCLELEAGTNTSVLKCFIAPRIFLWAINYASKSNI